MTTTPTPVERAARAHGIASDARYDGLGDAWDDMEPEHRTAEIEDMRFALAAALDPAEIARVLAEHEPEEADPGVWFCECDPGDRESATRRSFADHAAHQAAALIEHLTQTGATR